MPRLNSTVVRLRIAELDFDNWELARKTDIPYGALRNAVAGRDPMSLRRCYRVANALDLPVEKILAEPIATPTAGKTNDGVPDEPPAQPTGPTGPQPRPDRKTGKTGPRRTQSRRRRVA